MSIDRDVHKLRSSVGLLLGTADNFLALLILCLGTLRWYALSPPLSGVSDFQFFSTQWEAPDFQVSCFGASFGDAQPSNFPGFLRSFFIFFVRTELANQIDTLGDIDKKVLYGTRCLIFSITPFYAIFSISMFIIYTLERAPRTSTETATVVVYVLPISAALALDLEPPPFW